jgi:hypothetical protein
MMVEDTLVSDSAASNGTLLELEAPTEEPVQPALEAELETPQAGAGLATQAPAHPKLRGLGRFLALAIHPIPRWTGAVSGLMTGLFAGGLWAVLSFVVAAGSRQVHVKTPFGPRTVQVAINRWPQAVAIAFILATVLLLIAGVRLQMKRDASA